MSSLRRFLRFSHQLSNKIYPGGSEGRCSFNGRVVTVFGSSGNLGKIVVSHLGKYGTQVVAPYRCTHHDMTHLKIAGDLGQIYPIEFDPYDLSSIMNCIQYSDTVVNCLGTHSFPYAAKRSNIDVPRLIAEAVSQSPNINTFLHVSSMSQNRKDTDIISKTKFYGEKVVKQTCPNSIIVRPSTMYNNPDHFVKKDVVKIPTSMDDVGRAITQIVLENKHHGKIFELYGKHSYYMQDLVNFIYAKVNKPGLFINFLFRILRPMKFFARRYIYKFATLGLIPPHFAVDDVPSEDDRLLTFADLGMETTYAQDGIMSAISRMKPYAFMIKGGNNLFVYEQPHLRLPTKEVRDHFEETKQTSTHRYLDNILP